MTLRSASSFPKAEEIDKCNKHKNKFRFTSLVTEFMLEPTATLKHLLAE